MSARTQGALLSLLAFAIFAAHDALIKTLGGGYSAFQIIFFAVLFAFPLTTLMLVQDRTSGTLIPARPGWTALRTGSVVVSSICAFYAFSVLPLAQVYAILFATPLLITALSVPLLGEVVRLRRWLAVAVGLCGVIVVLRPGQIEPQLGHAAALLAAATGALSSTIVRKIGRDERPVVLLIYPMLAQFVLMSAAMPFVFVPMEGDALVLIGLLAILGHIAMRLMIRAYRVAEASTVAPMQYSQILWASLFGVLFFEEVPDVTTAIGAGIVIGSGLYILLRERSGASANSPVTSTRSRVVPGVHPRIGPQVDREGS
ncbi:MAG: DMT family transporter [Pseudomonadota bacterium]